MTTTTTPISQLRVGDVVTGTRLGGGATARRLTVQITTLVDDVAVVGLWAYASTFTEGGQYEASFRGRVVLDPTTVTRVREVRPDGSTVPSSLNFGCDTCGGVHTGEYHHDDQWNGKALYAVVCPTDWLTEYLNDYAATTAPVTR